MSFQYPSDSPEPTYLHHLLVPVPLVAVCFGHLVLLHFCGPLELSQTTKVLLIDYTPKFMRTLQIFLNCLAILASLILSTAYARAIIVQDLSFNQGLYLVGLYSAELVLSITLWDSTSHYLNWRHNNLPRMCLHLSLFHLGLAACRAANLFMPSLNPESGIVSNDLLGWIKVCTFALHLFLGFLFAVFKVKPILIDYKQERITFESSDSRFGENHLRLEAHRADLNKFILITLYRKRLVGRAIRTDIDFLNCVSDLYEEFNSDELLDILRTNRNASLHVGSIQTAFNKTIFRRLIYMTPQLREFLHITEPAQMNEAVANLPPEPEPERDFPPSLRYLLNRDNVEKFYPNAMATVQGTSEALKSLQHRVIVDFQHKGSIKSATFVLEELVRLLGESEKARLVPINPLSKPSLESALNILINEPFFYDKGVLTLLGFERVMRKVTDRFCQIFITKALGSRHNYLNSLNDFEITVFCEVSGKIAATKGLKRNLLHLEALVSHLVARVAADSRFSRLTFPEPDVKGQYLVERIVAFLNDLVGFRELAEDLEVRLFLEISTKT
jgi:hypothetical protein